MNSVWGKLLTFAGKVMPAEEEVASDFDFWVLAKFKSLILLHF